ncbi:hypothetical protein FM038_013505 [Shewanella eurypsychrophilus]|uniref:Uncharacterized protein n=1 Tax=Shewanella eurypsychrophilus TaxID=2593656 RepID=A0ABX6V9Z6_9GAMM|nr:MULTISPECIES: DUF6789 family protein [Shewanella]QFU23065.1 hypothetical protein FS418_15085 [Shewanella sp. YLB-09]QPG58348.1 hypothetical protein FM038_013505 [Shewanella eurypsychrophilus]
MDINKKDISKGLIAGLIATVALTAIMMIKSTMGIMPDFNPVQILADTVTDTLGLSQTPVLGWFLHFGLGSVIWGLSFTTFNNILPGKSQVAKGLYLGVIAWGFMMLGLMPIAGFGMFGLLLSMKVPVMTLMLHLVFGFALGLSYKKLAS